MGVAASCRTMCPRAGTRQGSVRPFGSAAYFEGVVCLVDLWPNLCFVISGFSAEKTRDVGRANPGLSRLPAGLNFGAAFVICGLNLYLCTIISDGLGVRAVRVCG